MRHPLSHVHLRAGWVLLAACVPKGAESNADSERFAETEVESPAESATESAADSVRDSGGGGQSGPDTQGGTGDPETDPATGEETDGPTDTETDTGTGPPPEPGFTVYWDADSVELSITDGAGDYWWGLAEVPVEWDCRPYCWSGEDCVYGWGGFSWCHDATATGVDLAYGASPGAVTEGVDTVFYDPMFAGQVSYYVEDDATGQCWIGGAEPAYYSGLGCTSASFLDIER